MNKNKNFNIPNILSVFRILLVPFIIWTYFKSLSIATIVLVAVSGLSDIIDGFVARHFNQITDLGKIIDPIADKLTQFAVAICIAIDHPIMWWIAGIIFAKELITLIGAILFVNEVKTTPQAKWWGKMATVIIFFTYILFLFQDVVTMPAWIDEMQTVMISVSIAAMAFSFFNYILVYVDGKKKVKNESENNPK